MVTKAGRRRAGQNTLFAGLPPKIVFVYFPSTEYRPSSRSNDDGGNFKEVISSPRNQSTTPFCRCLHSPPHHGETTKILHTPSAWGKSTLRCTPNLRRYQAHSPRMYVGIESVLPQNREESDRPGVVSRQLQAPTERRWFITTNKC